MGSFDQTKCITKSRGAYDIGALMTGIAQSHGKTELGGCDTVTNEAVRNITNLNDEEVAQLGDFITQMFEALATSCNDAYCKSDAFTDFDQAREKFDDLSEKFSRDDVWEAFDHALDELGDHTDRYDKEAAHDDSMNEVEHIFWDYEKDFLPKIMNRQCERGVYNDTATQLLLNNAFAETTNKAATLVLSVMENWEKLVLEGANLEIVTMRDFASHVYRMTNLQLDQINLYFEHTMKFAQLALDAMRVSLDSKTLDDYTSEMKTCYGKYEEHSLNLNDWAMDFGIVVLGMTLLEEFLFPCK